MKQKHKRKFILEIKTHHASFSEPMGELELTRLLRAVAQELEKGLASDGSTFDHALRDANGNTVGKATWK